MSDTGSSLSTVKAAIVGLLTAALPAVQVGYDEPVDAGDLNKQGTFDATWFGEATGTYDLVVMCGPVLEFEEIYELPLMVQTLRTSTRGTQQVADEALEVMLAKILRTLALDPALGVADQFVYLYALPGGWSQPQGFLRNGGGHGARREIGITVTCRHQYTA